jgi:hypothetical protein
MINQSQEISVTVPVSQAYDRVKLMLFQPFDLGKWFIIGFCAWLAGLGESGGGSGFNGNYNFSNNHSSQNSQSFRDVVDKAGNFVMENLYWIIPVAVAVVLLLLVLGMVLLWLNSRGKFMFLHCVALNKAEVSEPWTKFEREANSLFWFRFVVGLIGMVLSLPLLVIIAVIIVRMIYRGEPELGGIMLAVGLGLVFFAIAIFFALIRKFTVDFVVPIMFLRGAKCLAAWKEFFSLLTANAGDFALYILFQIVLAMAIGALVLIAIIVTCCIAGCLMALPYLGTVLLLPVLVFKRSYSTYFLAQFGPAYNVFPPAAPPIPGALRS